MSLFSEEELNFINCYASQPGHQPMKSSWNVYEVCKKFRLNNLQLTHISHVIHTSTIVSAPSLDMIIDYIRKENTIICFTYNKFCRDTYHCGARLDFCNIIDVDGGYDDVDDDECEYIISVYKGVKSVPVLDFYKGLYRTYVERSQEYKIICL